MPSCFVIQPFDGGPFDKRFEDVVGPAISDAGLEPYRVDRDPHVSIPIEQIEAGIRAAHVCFADITMDNPNVWFELGFAIAARKEVVLVCASSRERFPFDIQHRNVLTYKTDSSSDFTNLRQRVTARIQAILSKEAALGEAASVTSPLKPVEGLASHELVTLVAIAQNIDNPTDSVPAYTIRQDMERAGFTPIATTVALASLLAKDLVTYAEEYDEQSERKYTLYQLTSEGLSWLIANQERLTLKIHPPDEGRDTDVPF